MGHLLNTVYPTCTDLSRPTTKIFPQGAKSALFTRSYSLKVIEKAADFDYGVLRNNAGLTGSQSATKISISDLYRLVKTCDKDFSAGREVSPAVLNKDGTPKVLFSEINKKRSLLPPCRCKMPRLSPQKTDERYFMT